jgi:molybdopterin/thiamine biosynthesis adenylyltransferase
MNLTAERYDRNIRLFGEEGQRKLMQTRVALAGVGGLGSALAQHLALLGVGEVALIEPEELDETNRNRFIGAKMEDPVPGSRKVDLVQRMIHEIDPNVVVRVLPYGLIAEESFECIKHSAWVFGGFDHDGPRFVLNELCAAYSKPYIDLASDIPSSGEYGGHVVVSCSGEGCLHCLDLLDSNEVAEFLGSQSDRAARKAIYGVDTSLLNEKGPSVSPLNGVVASLGAMEFVVAVTGLRPPNLYMNFCGHLGTVRNASKTARKPDCPICNGIYGTREAADVERYLRVPHLRAIVGWPRQHSHSDSADTLPHHQGDSTGLN